MVNSLVREVVDRGNKIETLWYMGPLAARITQPRNKSDKKSALLMIANLKGIASRGTLVSDANVRIDNQGQFSQDGRNFTNIQIQINEPRRRGRSTAIAAVYVQTDDQILLRYVRDALCRSLQDSKEIWLQTRLWMA